MKWTSDDPSRPGFYWVKCKGLTTGKEYLQITQVYASTKDGPTDTLYLDADNYKLKEVIFITHYSDEPIPQPE
jgi:hypothetical protein